MAYTIENNARQNLRLKYSSALHFTQHVDVETLGQEKILFQAETKNFSAHGLQILCSSSLQQGQKLKLYLNLEPYGIIPINAVVQWISLETGSKTSEHWLCAGLKLDYSSSEESKKTVFSYLKERFLQAKVLLHAYA